MIAMSTATGAAQKNHAHTKRMACMYAVARRRVVASATQSFLEAQLSIADQHASRECS